MAFADGLEQAGYSPEQIKTVAHIQIDNVEDCFKITTIELETEARVPDIEEKEFLEQAQKAKTNCPVSRALAGVKIKLKAKLIKPAMTR